MPELSVILSTTVFLQILYFIVGLMGVISHFLKQKVKGETLNDIKGWFTDNPKETVLTLIAFIVSFLVLTQTGSMGYFTAFMSGYMSDSIFAKATKVADMQVVEVEAKNA